MNKVVTLVEAKSHFSAFVREAEEGVEITITRRGRPVARNVGAPRQAARIRGDRGWDDFYDKTVFAPISDEQAHKEDWPV